MIYRATHTTRYTYEGPVSHCLSEARLTPRILPNQRLLDWNLTVSPRPSTIISRKDYFGNDVSSFAVLEPHDRFTITATSLIEILPHAGSLQISPAWEDARDTIAELVEENEFIWESPFVPWLSAIQDYAKPVFTPGRPLIEAATALMQKIHADFKYKPESTSIETPLEEVLAARKGVCQDFSHIMIGALRSYGLAARYVSGYLRGDAEFQGAQASHAWVSVFVPNLGWIDFDPTNNVIPSTGHLTIAWGRDFGDVTPVKGITVGGGEHTLEVDVRVAPTPSISK
jgi:transglutaminase-like putative cysteine protease